jgi:glycosyltransferase involved in cell wall biosynthesis
MTARRRRLRIAHSVAVFPPHWAGTGNVCFHNALEVARLGHEVHVFTASQPLGNYADPVEVTVRRLATPFRIGNAPLTPALPMSLRGFDLVHLHWPFVFGAELTWLACQLMRIPYVVTYHIDLRADRRAAFGPYQAVWGPPIVRGARRVLAVSMDHLGSTLIEPHLRGREKRIVEVPNGVDTSVFHPAVDGTEIRHRYGVPDDGVLVGYVGAMDSAHEYKGVPVLLRALATLQSEPIYAVMVGDGDLAQTYRTAATELGLDERVRWAGSVEHGRELARYYAAFDLLAFPSLPGTESFGLVAVEAMASGRPVVASRLPGVRTVVDDEVTGLLVAPQSEEELAGAIRRLAHDKDDRVRFGAAGRTKATQRYDWRTIAGQLELVYFDVLGLEHDMEPSCHGRPGHAASGGARV